MRRLSWRLVVLKSANFDQTRGRPGDGILAANSPLGLLGRAGRDGEIGRLIPNLSSSTLSENAGDLNGFGESGRWLVLWECEVNRRWKA